MFELLTRLGVDTTDYDKWALHFEGANSTAAWTAAVIFVLLFVLFSWSSVRPAQRAQRRAVLFALRLLAAILVIGCLFQPSLRLLKTAAVKNGLAVLIDTSESMAIAGGKAGKSRIENAVKFIDENSSYFEKLSERFSVHYFGFDLGLHELGAVSEVKDIRTAGRGTDILGSLFDLDHWWKRGTLAGVILISDGQDTETLGRILKKGESEDAPAKEIDVSNLRDMSAPVHTVLAGDPEGLRDVSVREVIHDEYAFVHNPFEVLVRVGVAGEITSSVTVTLKGQGRVLASGVAEVKPGESEVEVKLDFIPRQVGEFFYTVEAPVYSKEASESNNTFRFALTVLRDKVRILYIVGNPSWDERFLRRALKKNPSVDLVSFYILREYHDDTYAPENELALIPFPTNELFTAELDSFDLVIFQNFFGAEYMRPEYMQNLSRYVRERGGGLLVIGGVRSFIRHSFNLPLEEVLPVRFSPDIPNYRVGEFTARLTPAGGRHPVTRIAATPEENMQTWESLPALEGYNGTLGVQKNGIVLVEHPFERAESGNLPVVAVMDAGRGRTMAVLTDTSWHWNFLAVGEGKSNKPYQIFWDNALRWLLKDPEMETVSLTREKGRYSPGEDVRLAIEVLDSSYKPAESAEVELTVIEEPDGSALSIPVIEPSGKGRYAAVLKPSVKGAYRIRAGARQDERFMGSDDVIFEVGEDSPEMHDLSLRPDLMRLIAESTGGTPLNMDDSPKRLEYKDATSQKIIGTQDHPLWDNAIALITVISLLVSEWFLRRRWGLS